MRLLRITALGSIVSLTAGLAISCGDDKEVTPGTTSASSSASSSSGAGGGGGSGGAGGAASGITIPGLTAGVSAVQDEFGLYHLTCAADDDCYAALGYFHAQNRFFFMDFVRSLVRGRLGHLVKAGSLVLKQDYKNRQFFSTAQGDPLERKLYDDASPEVKGHLDAYSKGVNAWIGDMRAGKNGATLTNEYDFALIVKANIQDWEPEDSAAVGLYVLQNLSDNSASELAMAADMPLFDAAFAPDLFSTKPVFNAFTVPAAQMAKLPPPPVPGGLLGKLSAARNQLVEAQEGMQLVGSGMGAKHPGEQGSNDWVVGPGLTTAGNALLANDPHLLLSNPSIWFGVELDAKSKGKGAFHVAGSTFPGLPSIMIGHNETVGWGVTTAYYDLSDEYLETESADGTTVTFQNKQVPIISKTLAFDDATSGQKVMQTLKWVPHHGPIVSEDAMAHTAVTIKWLGQAGGTDLDAFFGVAKSSTVAEAKKAIELASSANQNFVLIDKDGHIGWYPFSKVPLRPWASSMLPPWLPLPGDGSAEWMGTVATTDLPQLTDPPAQYIATANADPTGASADGDLLNDGQKFFQAFDKADGTRVQRIQDLIKAGGKTHTSATMTGIQGDDYSLYGSVVVPEVLLAAQGATLTPAEQDVIDVLTAWKYTCPTGLDGSDPKKSPKSSDATAAESIGCMAFHTTFYALVAAAVGDEITKAGVTLSDPWDVLLVARALHDPTAIASGDLLWDDVSTGAVVETKKDILLKALTTAAGVLSGIGAKDEWRWGRYHTLSLRSIYDNFGVTNYNADPVAAPGGQYTVNVANPLNRVLPMMGAPDFAFASGPSVRFVVEAAKDGLHMKYELPGGEDLHKMSPFYNNLLPNWLANKPIDFAFGPGAVTKPANTVTVNPG